MEPFRKLGQGEAFTGVTPEEKEAIVQGFGLSDMEQDRLGWNTKAGFAGYVDPAKNQEIPQRPPVPMLVRSIESGSSVRRKIPFVRPAVKASRTQAVRSDGGHRGTRDQTDHEIKGGQRMPKVGLSRPYVARYHENGAGQVSYSDGVRAGRAVELFFFSQRHRHRQHLPLR